MKVVNIPLSYENDENDIEFGVAEKNDGLMLLMTRARKLSAPTNKKVIAGSYKHPKWTVQNPSLVKWHVQTRSYAKRETVNFLFPDFVYFGYFDYFDGKSKIWKFS